MSDPDLNSPKAIIGAIGVMVMVPMFFLVMPMYVGALSEDYGFTNAQIGYLISFELGSAALASLTALVWLRRVNWRTVLLVFLVVLAAMNMLSIRVGGDYDELLLIRAIAGFSAGAMMAIALAALGDTKDQDRNFAFGVTGQLASELIRQTISLRGFAVRECDRRTHDVALIRFADCVYVNR